MCGGSFRFDNYVAEVIRLIKVQERNAVIFGKNAYMQQRYACLSRPKTHHSKDLGTSKSGEALRILGAKAGEKGVDCNAKSR